MPTRARFPSQGSSRATEDVLLDLIDEESTEAVHALLETPPPANIPLFGQPRAAESSVCPRGAGSCLESQNFPDAPSHANFPSCRLDPGQVYINRVGYKFGV